MPSGNSLFQRIRNLFAASEGPKAPSEMMSDAIYSESIIYAGAEWPKYNPDDLQKMHGYAIYRKMMQDEQIKAVTRFKTDAVVARQYYFDTKPTHIEDEENADGQTDAATGNEPESVGPGTEQGKDAKPDEASPSSAGKKIQQTRRARFDAGSAMPPQDAGGSSPDGDPNVDTSGEIDPGAEAGGEIPDADDPKSAEEKELERRAAILKQGIEESDGSFRDALKGIMSSMYNGFSMTEKVYKHFTFMGKTWIGIKHLRVKPHHSFRFYVDEYGNIDRVTQMWGANEENDISMDKFIHHVHNPEYDLHYGCSELRDAYRAYFSKDMIIRFMNIYLERIAGGMIWIGVQQGAANPDRATESKIQDILRNVTAKTGIFIPAGLEMHVEFPTATDAFERAIALYDKAISKALMVPNLLGISEQGSTGSYAQSQTQLEAFLWTLDSEAARLEETINKQLIQPLCDLNFGGPPYPVFKFEPISDTLKMGIIKTWNELVKAGAVTMTDTDENHLRQLLDFPEAGEAPTKPQAQIAIMPGQPPASGPTGTPQQTDPSQQTNPGATGKPGQTAPALPPKKPDETIIGKGQMRSSREAFDRAVKRVDFAVIDNRGALITSKASHNATEAMQEAVEEIKQFVKESDLFANPDMIADVKIPARLMTRIRKIAQTALKDAWDIGAEHARKELNKAEGRTKYVVDPLRLQDLAAEKFLESRSYTIAGDLADNARKKITTVLYNGIKNGWALEEIYNRIDDAVGADVLPTIGTAIRTTVFEAINEARYELFASPEMDGFVEALEFSAILDGRTTEICQHMDGRIYKIDNPLWESYTPPLHFNCRSLLIAVVESDKWTESPEPSIDPQDGFGG